MTGVHDALKQGKRQQLYKKWVLFEYPGGYIRTPTRISAYQEYPFMGTNPAHKRISAYYIYFFPQFMASVIRPNLKERQTQQAFGISLESKAMSRKVGWWARDIFFFLNRKKKDFFGIKPILKFIPYKDGLRHFYFGA